MEKPIIFSTPMVKAILEGRKTQTRRVIKINGYAITSPEESLELCEEGAIYYSINSMSGYYKPPYQVGDILWVRETCYYETFYREPGEGTWVYKADNPDYPTIPGKWTPSIYMPREAARIFLRVKNVRVERLQDITEEDAIAEGVLLNYGASDERFCRFQSYRDAFKALWDDLNKKRGYGWDINLWVWVIEFEKT